MTYGVIVGEQGSSDLGFSLDLGEVLILDGALATELERTAGEILDTALWSAETLIAKPSLIQQVHLDYYLAGARCAITSSYQASTQGLVEQKGLSEREAEEVMKLSVEVAKAARDAAYAYVNVEDVGLKANQQTNKHPSDSSKNTISLFVAGSVGPYGAYLSNGSEYTGAYALPSESMKDFHRGRIKALVEAGVDLLAIETQPNFQEIRDILELLAKEFPRVSAWISCTLRQVHDLPPTLSDGTSLRDLCALVDVNTQVVALGVNCCPKYMVTQALLEMAKWTSKPLVAYPNSGETWDAQSKSWQSKEDNGKPLHEYVVEWIEAGVRLIGGCCRTSPTDIAALRNTLNNLRPFS